jgi:hypothetical protein
MGMDWSLSLFALRRRALSRRGVAAVGMALALIGGGVVAPVAVGQRQDCQLTVTMGDPAAVLELQVYAGPRWSSVVSGDESGPVARAFLPTSGRAVFPLRCGTYVVVPVLTETGLLAGRQARPQAVSLDGDTTLALPLEARAPGKEGAAPS